MGNRKTRLVLAILAIGCFLYIGRNYLDQLYRITDANLAIVGCVALVHLLTLWLQGLTVKWGLDAFENSISGTESFGLFVISSYANLLLPRSGVGTTAVYLNRVRKTSLIDYSSVVLVNGALFVLACSAAAGVYMGIDWLAGGNPLPIWLVTSILGLLIASVLAVIVDWRFLNRYRGPGCSLIKKLNHAMTQLRASRTRSISRMALAHFVLVFLRALRLYFAFWALGIFMPFSGVLLMSVLGDLAFVFAITPGAVGFREAAIALAATQLGVPVSLALSVAVLDRLTFSLTVVITSQVLIAGGIQGSGSGWSSKRKSIICNEQVPKP